MIELSEQKLWITQAMSDLSFQQTLVCQGLMHRREFPESLRDELNGFSLTNSLFGSLTSKRKVRLGLVAGIILDLEPWILTPSTLVEIVTKQLPTNYLNSDVRYWMWGLRNLIPQLKEYLTTFPMIGYSLGVDKLDIDRKKLISLYCSQEWLGLMPGTEINSTYIDH